MLFKLAIGQTKLTKGFIAFDYASTVFLKIGIQFNKNIINPSKKLLNYLIETMFNG